VGVLMDGKTVNNLRFMDDIDLIAESLQDLQQITDKVHQNSKRFSLRINDQKMKVMTVGKSCDQIKVKLEEQKLEQVSEFVYLGSLITEDEKCTAEVKRRIGLASGMNGRFGKIWKSHNISNKTKVRLYELFVIPVLMYGAECWCLQKEDEGKISAAEMGWLRRIIRVARRDRMRNEVIREVLHQEETLVNKIKKK